MRRKGGTELNYIYITMYSKTDSKKTIFGDIPAARYAKID